MVEVTGVDDEAPTNTTNPQLLSQDGGQAERVGLESSRGASSILNPQMPTADTASPHLLSQIDAQIRQTLGDSVERMSFYSQIFESLSMMFDREPSTPTAATSNPQFSTATPLVEGLISTAGDRQLLEPTFGFRGSFLDTETYDQSLSMVFDPQLPPFPMASTSNSQSSTSTHSLSEGLIPTARQLLEPTFGYECLSFDSQTFDESLSMIFDLQPPTTTATTSNSQFSTSTHSLSEGLISTARDMQLLEPTFGFRGSFLDTETYDQSLSMVFDPQLPPFPMASTSNSQSSTSTHSLSEGLIPIARQLLEPTFGFDCLSDPDCYEIMQAVLPMTGLESL